MSLAASYDPLYPVRAAYRVSPDIVELVEIDIYQFLISTNGKRAVFRHLQNRLLKAIKFDQNVCILILSVFAILLTFELIGRFVEWWADVPEDLDPLQDGDEDAPDGPVGQETGNIDNNSPVNSSTAPSGASSTSSANNPAQASTQ